MITAITTTVNHVHVLKLLAVWTLPRPNPYRRGYLTQGSIPMDFHIGAIVDINLGRGVVRFYGTTTFSSGKWVGIELSEPVGKNDGSVKGISYFSCQMNYGVFVKPSQVKLAQDLPPTASVSPLHFSQIMS